MRPPKAPISERAFTTDFKGTVFPHTDLPPKGPALGRSRNSLLEAARRSSFGARQYPPYNEPGRMGRGVYGPLEADRRRFRRQNYPRKAYGCRARVRPLGSKLGLIERLLAGKSADQEKLEGLRTVQLIRSKVKGHSGGR